MSNPKHRKRKTLHALYVLLIAGVAAVCISPASAHYRETCWVKFRNHWDSSYSSGRSRHHDVWSQVFAVQCNYLTGSELNARARSNNYSNDRTYVLIIWPKSAPSVIRLTESDFCGVVTEAGCAERLSGRLTGRDDWRDAYGRLVRRTWQICQPGSFRRNCHRMLQ